MPAIQLYRDGLTSRISNWPHKPMPLWSRWDYIPWKNLNHSFPTVSLEKKLRRHALILKYAEQYTENQSFHIRYINVKNKESVFRKYESKLILYDGAKNELKRLGLDPSKVNPDEVHKDYQAMEKQRNNLLAEYKNTEKSLKELRHLKDVIFQYMDSAPVEMHQISKTSVKNRETL